MLFLLLGCPSVFGDNVHHTGLLDTATVACTGGLSPAPAGGVIVTTWTIDGVSRVVTPVGLCVDDAGTRAAIAVDDEGSEAWITVSSGTPGVFNLPSDDAQVSVDAGTVWSGDDVYAGTLSIDVGFGSLTAEATAAGGQNLSVDLSWTGSSL